MNRVAPCEPRISAPAAMLQANRHPTPARHPNRRNADYMTGTILFVDGGCFGRTRNSSAHEETGHWAGR